MKAIVDQDTCIGCQLCVGVCPEVFSMGDDGKSHAISGDIPSGEEDNAIDSRDSCPVSAISIEE